MFDFTAITRRDNRPAFEVASLLDHLRLTDRCWFIVAKIGSGIATSISEVAEILNKGGTFHVVDNHGIVDGNRPGLQTCPSVDQETALQAYLSDGCAMVITLKRRLER